MNLKRIATRIASLDLIPKFDNLPKNPDFWKTETSNLVAWGMSGALSGKDPETIG